MGQLVSRGMGVFMTPEQAESAMLIIGTVDVDVYVYAEPDNVLRLDVGDDARRTIYLDSAGREVYRDRDDYPPVA